MLPFLSWFFWGTEKYFLYYFLPAYALSTLDILCMQKFNLKFFHRLYISALSRLFEWSSPTFEELLRDEELHNQDNTLKEYHGRPEWEGLFHPSNLASNNDRKQAAWKPGMPHQTFKKLVADSSDFTRTGVEAIIEDQIGSSFKPQRLSKWNFLQRSKNHYQFKLKPYHHAIWVLGFIFRYTFLMPVRFSLFMNLVPSLWLTLKIAHWFQGGEIKEDTKKYIYNLGAFLGAGLGFVSTAKGEKPQGPVMCVMNHSSNLDPAGCSYEGLRHGVVVQKSSGFMNIFFKLMGQTAPYLQIDRSNKDDKQKLIGIFHEYMKQPLNPPLLVHVEGFCVNNSALMRFNKGVFEAADKVYPITIKYDTRFGDPFWSQPTFNQYFWDVITSWGLVCDVTYLPPVEKSSEETVMEFIARVKAKMQNVTDMRPFDWYTPLYRFPKVKEKILEDEKLAYSRCLQEALLSNETS